MCIGEEDPIYDQIVSFQENKCSYLYKNIGHNVSKVKWDKISLGVWSQDPQAAFRTNHTCLSVPRFAQTPVNVQ